MGSIENFTAVGCSFEQTYHSRPLVTTSQTVGSFFGSNFKTRNDPETPPLFREYGSPNVIKVGQAVIRPADHPLSDGTGVVFG